MPVAESFAAVKAAFETFKALKSITDQMKHAELKGTIADLANRFADVNMAMAEMKVELTDLRTYNSQLGPLRSRVAVLESENELLKSKMKSDSRELDKAEVEILVFLGRLDGERTERGLLHRKFGYHPSAKINHHIDNLCNADLVWTTLSPNSDARDGIYIGPKGRKYLADHNLFE